MTFLQLVQMFLLYSFLGWCSEVIFAAIIPLFPSELGLK